MSVSIHPPLTPEVFRFFPDSLSPPPTPIAKRARRFFPSADSTPSPTPTFFPKSQSLLTPEHRRCTSSHTPPSHQIELSSRPVPCLKLNPRPRFGTNITNVPRDSDGNRRQVNVDELPLLPLWMSDLSIDSRTLSKSESTPTSTKSAAPLVTKSASNGTCLRGCPEAPKPVLGGAPHGKMPSFQRRGMHARSAPRRINSFAARSA